MPDILSKGELTLRCRLSNLELVERQNGLVKGTAKRGRLESELEAWKAEKRENQKLLEGEIAVVGAECVRLATAVDTGEERREVKVEYWLRDLQVDTVRTDTGEVVSSRPAMDHELQRQLPNIEGAEPENEATHASRVEDEHPMLPPPAEAEEHHEQRTIDPLAERDFHPEQEDDAPPPSGPSDDDLDGDHGMEWGGVGGDGTTRPDDE